jgi:TRAP-type C4-dicarboxylate transport system substrate-binding protein
MNRRTFVAGSLAGMALLAYIGAAAAQGITLHGAVQFNDDHAFNRALLKFEELVKKYYGKPITFVLHRNSELGLEKEYFLYMNQGKAVDYAIVSPAHMSTFSRAAPFIDAPFLFRDLDSLEQRCSMPICSNRSPTRSRRRPTSCSSATQAVARATSSPTNR